MCVIIACPPGRTPDFDDHLDGIRDNDDGHGWAIRTPHGIEMWKGLIPEQGLGTFLRAREQWPDDWAIWHSRFATHGIVDEFNCQPFQVPGHNWVMAHNGIFPLSDGPFEDRRSDSRIFAEDHLSRMEWPDFVKRFDELDWWINPSKVVVLNGDPAGEPIMIFGEDRGTWSYDHCWWSSRPWGTLRGKSLLTSSSKPRWACGPSSDEYWETRDNETGEVIFDDPRDFDRDEDEEYERWLMEHAISDKNQEAYNEFLSEVDRGK